MLIDHIGLFLFPDILIFRYIGRIAFPLFAFFIAEGCRYTSGRLRYFLNVFVLAVLCQSVYLGEMLVGGVPDKIYLNVLFTFSLSIAVCLAYFNFKNALSKSGSLFPVLCSLAVFATVLLFAFVACFAAENLFETSVRIEYGFAGVLLPLFAALFRGKYAKLFSFSIGTLLFSYIQSELASFSWFALFAVVILALYNGKRGTRRLKYAFYLFYPVQFGVLYLISTLF